MYPVIIEFGPITIYSFGLMMAVAFLSAAHLLGLELQRKGYNRDIASSLMIWAAVGGLVGARLWLVIDKWESFLADPIGSVISGAGFVWYGGLIGGALAVGWVARRQYKIPFLRVADSVAPGLAVGHGIGRFGCQLAGDGDWGSVTTLPWGMAYESAIIGWDYPPGVKVHPAPLYEAGCYFAIAAILWRWRKTPGRDGVVFSWYLISSSIVRFLVEFVRINPAVWLNLTAAQVTSVILAIVGIGLFAALRAPLGQPVAAAAGKRT
jgi:phosphatidylglycerol:prolipoprotein diacylglycerol transferase